MLWNPLKQTQRSLILIALLAILMLHQIVVADHKPAQKNRLKIVWVSHDASKSLASIAKNYQPSSGIKVEVIMLPYGSDWHSRIATELNAKGDGFDLAVWDSQSLAEFAAHGHIELLNPYMAHSTQLSFSDFEQNSLKRYAEYPEESGKMWAIPINQDALGLVYRKDLFDDVDEQRNFKQRFGYPLSPPSSYQQLQDIAQFFTRPEQDLYGWGQFSEQEYDLASSAANGFIWSYGGQLWNNKTNEIIGYLDSPASIDGLEQYLKMFNYSPDSARDWGYIEVNNAFKQGRLVMASQWFVFFDELAMLNQTNNGLQAAFASLPGATGRDGIFRRNYSLGGQGIGINHYSKKKKEAWAFIEWFMQDKQQWRFSLNGKTSKKSILDDPKWHALSSQNKAFANTMTHVNDYWHLPEYIKLLEILQQEITSTIQGRKTAKQALMMAARRQEAILKKAGYRIERKQSKQTSSNTNNG